MRPAPCRPWQWRQSLDSSYSLLSLEKYRYTLECSVLIPLICSMRVLLAGISIEPAGRSRSLGAGRTVTGPELSVCGLVATLTLFILSQSYGNSRPQSRHTTYVPVTDAAALRRCLPLTVRGKL